MLCPTCGKRAQIINSRPCSNNAGQYRYRRYECRCGERFSTAEVIVYYEPGAKVKEYIPDVDIRFEDYARWVANHS
jgi:transcriptional regulator NrdR family protein